MASFDFDDLKQKGKAAAETIADKSVEIYKAAEEKVKYLAKTTKLSSNISSERSNIKKLYSEIGKIYYDLHKDAPESALTQVCEEVTASFAAIDTLQKELSDLKTQAKDDGIDVEIIVEDDVEVVDDAGNNAE